MFSFHKPKVYRSTTGCCICKAKSSSSRFTDSKKYEDDFVECFNLKERRSGEICNACVLLVKRWKKLPKGTDRNWHHVVDARAGPGTKSLTKFKSKKLKKNLLSPDKPLKEKIKKKHRYIRKEGREGSPGALSDDIAVGDERLSEGSGPSVPGSLAPSPYPSPYPSEDDADSQDRTLLCGASKRKKSNPTQLQLSSFVDLSYWKHAQFTDSKKYEDDFVECFNLKERRSGEICNTCVLVKCWKKLPKDTDRNWHHLLQVVGAQAGPGTKSLAKFKSKKLKINLLSPDIPLKEKIKKKHRYIRKDGREGSPEPLSDDIAVSDERLHEGSGPSVPGFLAPSPYPFEDDADSQDCTLLCGASKRKNSKPTQLQLSSFVDLSYWKQEKVCCGLIFRGDCGEVLIDPRFFQPCSCRIKSLECSPEPTPASTPRASSGASDGGSNYDDEILDMMSEANMNEDEDYQDSDSLDDHLDESYYSSAANSPSAPLMPQLHTHTGLTS